MKNRLFYFLNYWAPVIAYCAFIYFQSSYPTPDRLPQFRFGDKVFHIVGYALLGALFLRAYLSLETKANSHLIMLISVLSAGLYGLSDELHQYFVPFRTADVLDAVADTIGSVVGVFCYHFLMVGFFKAGRKQQKQIYPERIHK